MHRDGLKWRKIDLHVHTPASDDYKGSETPDEFVQKAIQKGLDGIAVTDHNTADWVNKVIEAAKGTDLVVFPGVELTVTGGKSSIHIVGIFDPRKNSKHIEQVLTKAGFTPEQYGDLEAVTKKSVIDTLEIIDGAGGLAVGAHIDSSKGITSDMRGQARIEVMNSQYLSAVEVTKWADTTKYLDGSDDNYKKIAAYRASDNPHARGGHTVESVGDRYTWFKMDSLDLEGLRQCFNDSDVRIRADVESTEIPDSDCPYISDIKIEGGFLDGQHFIFHKGLNCIIGGKGVGKSVLIELLRFALEQTSDQEAIQKDTEGKLKDQLGKESSVTVRVVTRTGRALDVKRVYDGQDNPTQVRDVDTTNTINVKINDLFPILAYSQTEALEIARDNHAQLRLIDLFIDMASFKSDAKALRLEISKMDNQLIDALKAKEQLSEVRGNLCTLKEKKREVDDALTSDVKSRYNEAKKIDDRVAELLDYISNIKDDLTGYVDELKERQIDISVTDDDADIIQAITDLVGDVKDSTLKGLAGLVGKIDTLQKNAKLKNEEWTEEFEDIEDQYSEWVTQQGADAEALSEERERIGNEIKKLETRIESLEKEANSAEEITANRSKKLDELHDLRDELYHCRKEKYDQITEASDGRLQLDLEKEGIDEPFLEALGRILYGSNIRANDKEGIVNTTTPRDFVERIIQDDDDYFVEHVQMSERACENLFSHFEEVEDLKTLLPLQYRPLLEDKPLIQFKKSNGQYYPLEKISIGQKCTCLLIIALAEGSRPVLIDQPEDALDIRSVYTDITMQLRDRKVARQFILTTHNPTVAVTSDSDQFHVMKADATKGRCSHSGAIEVKTVRDEVIQHLEGGEESYILKNRKYNVNR